MTVVLITTCKCPLSAFSSVVSSHVVLTALDTKEVIPVLSLMKVPEQADKPLGEETLSRPLIDDMDIITIQPLSGL